MKRIALQGLVIAPLFIVAPAVWQDCQPAAGLALALSGFGLIWSDHETEAGALVLGGAALAVSVLTMPAVFSRPGGYYINPNIAGAALAMLLMLALYRRAWAWAGLIGLGLGATVSVGAILGAGAGLGILGASEPRFRRWAGNHKRLVILGVLGALVLALGAGAVLVTRRNWLSERPALWHDAVLMIKSDPLTGGGAGSYWRSQFVLGFNPDWSRVKPKLQPHAHNIYLHIGAEYGLPALALVLVGAGLIFWKSNPPGRAALAVVAVHGLVDATILYIQPALVLYSIVYIGGAFDQWRVNPRGQQIDLAGG